MLSHAHVCGLSTAGILGSNPAEGMDVRLLCLLCVVWVAASATSLSLVQFESYRVCVSNGMWSRNLNNEVA
jgi:hypothetical protein